MIWVLIVLFVPETAYVGPAAQAPSTVVAPENARNHADPDNDKEKEAASLQETHSADAHDAAPVRSHEERVWWKQIPSPFAKFLDAPILLCAITFAICFGWSVGLTIINPQVFTEPPYNFNPVQVGGVYMSALIGAIFGKLLGGYIVDVALLTWRSRVNADGTPNAVYAEQRLWSLLAFLPLGIVGLLCYGFGLGNKMSWPVAVIPGQAFYYTFFNIISSILQTYCVEIEPYSGVHLISFLNFVKCAWAFGISFYVPPWALPSAHSFYTSFVVQMVVIVVLIFLVVAMASVLRQGAIPRRGGRKALEPRIHLGI